MKLTNLLDDNHDNFRATNARIDIFMGHNETHAYQFISILFILDNHFENTIFFQTLDDKHVVV